jgi:release factor glutamine methyltransferase
MRPGLYVSRRTSCRYAAMPTSVINSPQTLADALHTATLLLERASSSARLDAELLLEYVTGQSRTSFRAFPERGLPAQAGWAFQQLVMRRLKGEPIAYIRGQQEFWSLLFEVSPAVLIPRPETETLVERALARIDMSEPRSVLDLGTGSGAVALAIANERRNVRVVATDISKEALAMASRNAGRLQIATVTYLQGSWYAPVGAERFDVIVSNPPYIAAEDPDLAADVRRHEPAMALISGPSGVEALESIVKGAPSHLTDKGWLLLEHGWKQGAATRDLLVRAGFINVRSHPDLAGRERVTEGQRS